MGMETDHKTNSDLSCLREYRVDASKDKKEAPQKTNFVMVSIHMVSLIETAITSLQCICQVVVLYPLNRTEGNPQSASKPGNILKYRVAGMSRPEQRHMVSPSMA